VTGLSSLSPVLSGKRLELVKAVIGDGARVAVLWDLNGPGAALAWQESEAAAPVLGLQLQYCGVRGPEGFETGFASAVEARADGLVTLLSPLVVNYRARIAELAAKHRLPALYPVREFADAGGLMAYGPSLPGLYRRTAYFVDRILKGAKPADLPVEQPREFDFVVNMKTARELGITFPPEILLQVTEMIE
jgi:putative tryptophan/tyrosine transport system substrate-binding protein